MNTSFIFEHTYFLLRFFVIHIYDKLITGFTGALDDMRFSLLSPADRPGTVDVLVGMVMVEPTGCDPTCPRTFDTILHTFVLGFS